MRIFKFGGASVKDADGIKNVYNVLQQVGYEDVLLVVSAMGKTTNALEELTNAFFYKNPQNQFKKLFTDRYKGEVMDLATASFSKVIDQYQWTCHR